jgi:hypothetical protein
MSRPDLLVHCFERESSWMALVLDVPREDDVAEAIATLIGGDPVYWVESHLDFIDIPDDQQGIDEVRGEALEAIKAMKERFGNTLDHHARMAIHVVLDIKVRAYNKLLAAMREHDLLDNPEEDQ